MDLGLIIQLLSGAAGGNLAAKILPKFSLGTLANSLFGILGGGLGGQLLGMLGVSAGSGGTDLAGIIGSILSGGVGGGALLSIISFIKSLLGK